MAEHIRRPGGEMVPYRGPSTRRNLLPVEVQIIEALNLTEEEYWHFCDLTAAHNGKRSKEYDHVPDIRNEPISAAMWTVIAINLAVGVALTAVSFLLRPKPKEQGATAPPSLETDDSIGSKRFAPTSSFSAVQSLAVLGSPVPLVFCRRENKKGGVRVNGQLLWSHLASKSGGQELRALMLISAGKLESEPEYSSYAIGDNKLCNISPGKVALYFKRNGGRTIEGNLNGYSDTNTRYPEGILGKCSSNDAHAVQWLKSSWTHHEQCFSGCRNPSGSSQFGVYSPLPNANEWRMEHELVLIPTHDGKSKELKGEQEEKKDKVYWGSWRKRCYVAEYTRQENARGDNGERSTKFIRLNKGDYFNYIVGDGEEDWDYHPWGVADVRNAVLATRQNAADTLMVGELYAMGNTIAVLTEIEKKHGNETWKDKHDWWRAWFRVVDAGEMRTYGYSDKLRMSVNTLVLMRAAVATIANNRECDCTEIGIKSKVFGRISASNVNSIPSEYKIKRYQDKGGSISLGRIDQYITRFSFFLLEVRFVGAVVWTGLHDGSHFCVEGRTPTAIFNSIKIYHPRGQYEFRLRPCSGNYIQLFYTESHLFHRLKAIGGKDTPSASNHHRFDKQIKGETFTVVYAGQCKRITYEERCNKEWIVHEPEYEDPREEESWEKNFRDSGWYGNLNKFDAMSDYWAYDSEQKSHESAPEHEVTFVNELLIQDAPAQYPDMAYAGIRIQAGHEINTFTQFSAFIERGMIVPGGRLIDGTRESTNLLPEIAWSLLVSNIYGLGRVVGKDGVDSESMTIAAKFCKKNGFTWNGVIGKKVNIRNWIFEQAGYCFLDFVVKGGLFSLKPSVIYSTTNYSMRKNADLRRHVKALFTDGNISELKTTFLSAEDRQEFQAVCLWRSDKKNGFPETRTVSVRRNHANSSQYPEETFDMSGWCTNEEHAIKWAKWAVLNRVYVDHAVTFKTTPDCIVGMEPGNLFRLQTEASHVTRFSNGSVDSSGNIRSNENIKADKNIYYWKPGTEGVLTGKFKYEKVGGRSTTLAAEFLRGCLFATYSTTTSEFIYKCESISHAEDGFIELAGVYQPINSAGESKLLDWDDADWIVERS